MLFTILERDPPLILFNLCNFKGRFFDVPLEVLYAIRILGGPKRACRRNANLANQLLLVYWRK